MPKHRSESLAYTIVESCIKIQINMCLGAYTGNDLESIGRIIKRPHDDWEDCSENASC